MLLLTQYCWNSCSVCTGPVPINFSVNMTQYAGSFTTVYVSGSFNGWSGNANPLSDPNGDGIWTGTINIPNGTYEFKFTAKLTTGFGTPQTEQLFQQ